MSRRLFIFVFINLIILAGSISMGMYAHINASRYFAQDIIYIAPKLNESHLHWTMEEVDLLGLQFYNYSFSAESRSSVTLSTNAQTVTATVVYTDAAYFGKHFTNFTQGSIWHEESKAIIINETLAWRLFGGGNIIGLSININEEPFIISGVINQGENYRAWKPQSTAPTPLPVTALYVRANNYNLVDIGADSRGMISNRNDFSFVDINRYIEAISIRYRIFMYLLWTILLIYIIKKMVGLVKQFDGVNMKQKGYIEFFALTALGIIALAVLNTGVNDILFWLPNLAVNDVSIWQSITNIGVFPPDGYLSYGLLRLDELNNLANIAIGFGFIGLVNLLFFVSI